MSVTKIKQTEIDWKKECQEGQVKTSLRWRDVNYETGVRRSGVKKKGISVGQDTSIKFVPEEGLALWPGKFKERSVVIEEKRMRWRWQAMKASLDLCILRTR